ncbi:MAG: serine hydrolase domain-containing protein [Thermomicrobiales bacterium]
MSDSAATVAATKDWVFDDAARERVERVFAAWDTPSTPGMAVGIYREGEVVYTHGFGMANLEHDIPIAPNSIFHIASISKQFTDMCIALLQAEGALDVDDDIRLYVPEVPDFGETITIRHLIHHVSGLRDQWMLLYLAGWREEDLVTDADVLDLVSRQQVLNFSPNTEYLYCNTGYTLPSIVVKRVSGLSLRQFAQARIFGPLGMTRTHFHDDHSEIVKGRTQAYEPRKGGGYHVSIPEFDVVGTTSLFTTVEDLAKWDGNFISAQVGGPEVVAELQRPGTFADGKPMTYAWGLTTDTYRGAIQIGHGGADHGYRSDYFRLPEFGLTVTVLSNVSDSGPHGLATKVADAVIGDLLAPATVPGAATGKRTGVPVPVKPSALAGTWSSEKGTWLTIAARDGKAWLEMDEPWPLEDGGNGRFVHAASGIVVVPAADAASLDVTFAGETVTYARAASARPSAEALDALAGSYWSEELGVPYEIIRDGGPDGETIAVRRRKFPDMTYRSLADDVFGRGSLDWGSVLRFQRGGDGAVTGFTLTAGRIRNLAFAKR